MPVGIGIDMHNGVGRSPLDDRILARANFASLGILRGCVVTGSSTAMSYSVSPGSDPVSVAVGERGPLEGATPFQVPTASIATTAAPASGLRSMSCGLAKTIRRRATRTISRCSG